MRMKDLTNHRLVGRTIHILSRALDFRTANHNIISGNLANIDTPRFKPQELKFDEELKRAVDRDSLPLRTTNREHFSHFSSSRFPGSQPFVLKEKDLPLTKSDQLNIDREMANLAQNNILYEASARLLAKKIQALKAAIEEGRR